VSNIGYEVEEKQLEGHFSVVGKIQRLKIIRKYGRNTGRAYITFYDEEAARRAIDELHD